MERWNATHARLGESEVKLAKRPDFWIGGFAQHNASNASLWAVAEARKLGITLPRAARSVRRRRVGAAGRDMGGN